MATQVDLQSEIHESAFFFCPRLAKIKRHVDEHFDQPFTLAQAAHMAALEKSYFSRIFHEKVGIRFTEWLARERIKRALLMLMSFDHRVTDLALAVGFGNLRSFERAFKKFAGVTPAECKEIIRHHIEEHGSTRGLQWEEISPTHQDLQAQTAATQQDLQTQTAVVGILLLCHRLVECLADALAASLELVHECFVAGDHGAVLLLIQSLW